MKKIKITRKSIRLIREPVTTIEINIKPGWKDGTKITYSEGDELPDGSIQELVFIIREKPHDVFKRDKNDLIFTRNITLKEALCGHNLMINSLDGRPIEKQINDVVSPNYETIIPNEGMPVSKYEGTFGNLRIKYNIEWPK